MKRNNYPKRKNSEQMDEPKKVVKISCMECGSSHGTMRKINDHGKRGYLCEYCFAGYQADNES